MTWIFNNLDLILELVGVHLLFAIPAIVLSLVISIPLGWAAYRWKIGGAALLTLIGLLYTIPSLPMFILVPALVGTDIRSGSTMVIVLTLYGIALMVRSVTNGFDSVPPAALKAAEGIGYSPRQKFWAVQLPLAAPVILAGLRVVVVSTVSLVTVGAVVGIQSLGYLFTDGFQRGIIGEVLCGIVLTVVLALLLDAACVLAGKLLLPWTNTPAGAPTETAAKAATTAKADVQ
ncbi:ABC transporter permease subunit [Corynebacterium callunae]|uniref:ABC transporter permease n=1 Tax=Corynebacterium callunae TaxID=1721 RepID=UPI003982D129